MSNTTPAGAGMEPCPYCATTPHPKDHVEWEAEITEYAIRCPNCGALGPNDISLDRAREMWNLRRTATAQHEQLQQQLRNERRMFEDLTPGGSEFHDSPRNVLRWIQQQLNGIRVSTIVELKRENATLRAQHEQLQQRVQELESELTKARFALGEWGDSEDE